MSQRGWLRAPANRCGCRGTLTRVVRLQDLNPAATFSLSLDHRHLHSTLWRFTLIQVFVIANDSNEFIVTRENQTSTYIVYTYSKLLKARKEVGLRYSLLWLIRFMWLAVNEFQGKGHVADNQTQRVFGLWLNKLKQNQTCAQINKRLFFVKARPCQSLESDSYIWH